MAVWAGVEDGLAAEVAAQSAACLDVYRRDPLRVQSDVGIESNTAEGGYGRKQLFELVQNGADALLGSEGRIHVIVTEDSAYIANEGKPVTTKGLQSLMASHIALKRGDEIGRFGLGFKSVVAITDNPQIYSRSGSFEFDRQRSRDMIEPIVGDAPAYPMLRLAHPLDPDIARAGDPILDELMNWATTVIKIPLLERTYDGLAADIESFPAEFLLFSPHANTIVLEDRERWVRRDISVNVAGKSLILDDNGKRQSWIVASVSHKPSQEALEDAGERAHRDEIKVWWAVPKTGRAAVGQIWAFFPTDDKTTLSGIVNAPWKVGDDRRSILQGRFNEEILSEVLPSLVQSVWSDLVDPDDPTSVIDLLPARGREARSWADDVLNEPVFTKLRWVPALPDTEGNLQPPKSVQLHPKDVPPDLLDLWSSYSPSPSGWVHHGVDKSTERRSKAERLLGQPGRYQQHRSELATPVTPWIEALCQSSDVAAAAVGIALVDAFNALGAPRSAEARQAKVVLLEGGSWTAAVPGRVFVRSSPEESGYQFIDPALASLPAVHDALSRLGVTVLDRAGELRSLLSARAGSVDWNSAWSLIRQCTNDVATKVITEELGSPVESKVNVRTRAGSFVTIGEAFLPGAIVSPASPDDRDMAIDADYHRDELDLLGVLGAVPQPTTRTDAPPEAWLQRYRQQVLDNYVQTRPGGRPLIELLEVAGPTPPWPLEPLERLSESARMAMTELVLGSWTPSSWTVRHQTNANYGTQPYQDPVEARLRAHGRLRTAFGPLAPKHCLLGSPDYPADVLPVVDLSEELGRSLAVHESPEQFDEETWSLLLQRAEDWDDIKRLSGFYAWAAYFATRPQFLMCQVGHRILRVPTGEVAVATSEDMFASLTEQNIPAILVVQTDDADDAARLRDAWELEDGAQQLEQEVVFAASGEPALLVDVYPKLRLYPGWDPTDTMIQICDSISLITATRDGSRTKQVEHALVDRTVLVASDDQEALLSGVSAVLQLGLEHADIAGILDHVREQAAEELVAELRGAASDDERLARLIGLERLRRAIPAAALEIIEADGRKMTPVQLAALVKSVQGVGALQYFKVELQEQGLTPPHAWAGTATARKFVMDLGFSPDLAGFASNNPPSAFAVDGPADLGPLHDYQLHVTARLRDLIKGGGSARGMVSLPTGAGKTRVAVQALVEAIRDDNLRGPIVWIAQSEELCEQAVEAWSYVWRAIGPRERLNVSRFWGSNPITEVADELQLIIATPNKLLMWVDKTELDWVTKATVVVIDEAHTSVTSMYTEVLEWLGRGSRGQARRATKPLVGLTATPFRGTSGDETKRLAKRYDENRLDKGAFGQSGVDEDEDPYAALQDMGVLAKVNHTLLQGAKVNLTASEVSDLKTRRWLSSAVEARLGRDAERNQTIVDSILGLPEDWTVLLFATSVENAAALAALLTHSGVASVAISGSTDTAARRHYVEEFKAGRIRVITNHSVFTQGFDAPKVQAVYVTRPTFSPNVYQQMIGRGLRGPLNGGSEEVLIVNVADTFNQFGEGLAFREFEHLWEGDNDEDASEVADTSGPGDDIEDDVEPEDDDS